MKVIIRTLIGTMMSVGLSFAPGTPAIAGASHLKNVFVGAWTLDKGSCSTAVLAANLTANTSASTKFALKVTTSRGSIERAWSDNHDYPHVNAGCVSKAFVKDVKAKKVYGTITAYTSGGKFLARKTVRVQIVDTYGC